MTTKQSLWKRVGGWLGGSHETVGGTKLIPIDQDGLIDEQSGQEELPPDSDAERTEPSTVLLRPGKKEQQIVAIEEGFNRLVDVLQAINENVVQQRLQTSEMAEKLQPVTALPESLRNQQDLLKNIKQELKNSNIGNQGLLETLKDLPELTQSQLNKLTGMTESLQETTEHQKQNSLSLDNMARSMQTVAGQTDSQTNSLQEVSETLKQNEQFLQDVLAKQNKRLYWLLAIVALPSLLAIAIVLMRLFGIIGQSTATQ